MEIAETYQRDWRRARDSGAMIAIELFEKMATPANRTRLTADIVARAREKGLILPPAASYYNILRILVPSPLLRPSQIRQGLEIIAQCFDAVRRTSVMSNSSVDDVIGSSGLQNRFDCRPNAVRHPVNEAHNKEVLGNCQNQLMH